MLSTTMKNYLLISLIPPLSLMSLTLLHKEIESKDVSIIPYECKEFTNRESSKSYYFKVLKIVRDQNIFYCLLTANLSWWNTSVNYGLVFTCIALLFTVLLLCSPCTVSHFLSIFSP